MILVLSALLVAAVSPCSAAPPAQKFLPVQKWLAAQVVAPELVAPEPVWQKEAMPAPQELPLTVWQKGPAPAVQKMPAEVWQKSAPVCCCPPTRHIAYWDHRICRRKCCSCVPPVQMVLVVTDPCCPCKCAIEVPVCVPGCCLGSPVIAARHDLLGRGLVTCTWPSGFKVRIVFRHTGDLLVHYCGH